MGKERYWRAALPTYLKISFSYFVAFSAAPLGIVLVSTLWIGLTSGQWTINRVGVELALIFGGFFFVLALATAILESLPFTFVNIGENLSQAANGGFNAEPPGNWTAIKIFIGEGEQEADLFLNINEVSRKGQFSIKDPDYGDLALAQLAKVL